MSSQPQRGVAVFRVLDTLSPVLVEVSGDHGRVVSVQVDGANVASAQQGVVLQPRQTATIQFAPLLAAGADAQAGARVPFRVSYVVDGRAHFAFQVRANIAPAPPTQVLVAPQFNRNPITPWFIIVMSAVALALLAAAIAVGKIDRETPVARPVERGWIAAAAAGVALCTGFVVFWAVTQGYVSSRDSSAKCQHKATIVARGKAAYTYRSGDSDWDKFLCRVLGACRCMI